MKRGEKIAIFLLACLAFIVCIVAAFFLFPEQTIPHVILSETPQFEGVPRNEYHKELFQNDNGFLRYDGENSLVGIDVSSHQGEIDWTKVKESGVEFAIIRAAYRGYTNGGLSVDDRFLENLEGAKNAGLQVGVYLFSQAITEEEVQEEIDLLLFFRDPLSPKPHEPKDHDLLRLCDMHNIPVATNIATGEVLIHGLERGDLDWRNLVRSPMV